MYAYSGNNRGSGSGYTRDIQNIYRRQKPHNSNDNALPKLPRISNQRDIGNQIVQNKVLPAIQGSNVMGGPQLSNRNA